MEKTKLIATISAGENEERQIEEFIKNGIDVIRLNQSYTTHDDCVRLLKIIDKVNEKFDTHVATMFDLEGPCIRTGLFSGGKARFNTGDKIRIYMEKTVGDMTGFSVNYPELIDDLKYKTIIKLSKGNVILEVVEKGMDYALCNVLKGGFVTSYSKMYLPEIKINKKFLSQKDYDDILFAHENDIDYITASAISSSEDVLDINDILIELKDEHMSLIAKIENKRAYEDLDNIINASDGIILDRGDIGIELPVEMIPNIQNKVIRKCYESGKLCIITAEFGSYMKRKMVPNRAEVSDLSTLVSAAVDGILLTSETTIGMHPIETVKTVQTIVKASEDNIDYNYFFRKSLSNEKQNITATISSSVVLGANELDCKAILVATNMGNTARRISRLKPPCPIIAAAEGDKAVKSLQLYFGVLPIIATGKNIAEVTDKAKEKLKDVLHLKTGDRIIVTGGYPFKKVNYTNFMEIIEI
ncbi:MAG: pyruvate kinase [Bacilli bacterium]|nr:pyruvate kinase [Bacilli bacterium]